MSDDRILANLLPKARAIDLEIERIGDLLDGETIGFVMTVVEDFTIRVLASYDDNRPRQLELIAHLIERLLRWHHTGDPNAGYAVNVDDSDEENRTCQ